MDLEKHTIDNSKSEISLKGIIYNVKEIFMYLLSKKYIIITICLIGGILGFLYAKSQKIIYTASTTFVIEGESGPSMLSQYAGLASMIGMDLGSKGEGLFQGENLLELYRSRSMIEKTLMTSVTFENKDQLLVDRYIDMNDLREEWVNHKNAKNLLKIDFKKSRDSDSSQDVRLKDSLLGVFTKDLLKNNLKVNKLDKKMSIIEVSVSSSDELFSKRFDEELVNNVNEFYINTKTKKSLNNVHILQSKVDSVRGILNGSISAGAAAIDATPNLNPTRQALRQIPTQRAQFSAETNKAILSELVKNLELTKMSLLRETPLIQRVDEPILPLEFKKKSKLIYAFVGCFAAFFLSVSCYFILYLFRKSLK